MLILVLSFGMYLFALLKRHLLYVGFLLQAAYIVSRGFELGRLPLAGPHDTLVFLSASIAALSMPISRILKNHSGFQNGIAITAAAFTLLAITFEPRITPLPPILRIIWFELHVVLAFLGYALFAIAAVLGYLFLKEKTNLLEGLQYRSILIGYCFFSVSMIFGGIWAYLAWGTYWVWTPKELWTAILWMFYSLYLHVRLRQWWIGRPAAILGIAGFGVVMFTYLGVSLLMKSSHSW